MGTEEVLPRCHYCDDEMPGGRVLNDDEDQFCSSYRVADLERAFRTGLCATPGCEAPHGYRTPGCFAHFNKGTDSVSEELPPIQPLLCRVCVESIDPGSSYVVEPLGRRHLACEPGTLGKAWIEHVKQDELGPAAEVPRTAESVADSDKERTVLGPERPTPQRSAEAEVRCSKGYPGCTEVHTDPTRVWLSPISDSDLYVASPEDDGRGLPSYVLEHRTSEAKHSDAKLADAHQAGIKVGLELAAIDAQRSSETKPNDTLAAESIITPSAVVPGAQSRSVRRREALQRGEPMPTLDARTDKARVPICPCVILERGCSAQCTCRSPVMGGGCRYCASYGNVAQQMAAAKRIANAVNAQRSETAEVDGAWAKLQGEQIASLCDEARKQARLEAIEECATMAERTQPVMKWRRDRTGRHFYGDDHSDYAYIDKRGFYPAAPWDVEIYGGTNRPDLFRTLRDAKVWVARYFRKLKATEKRSVAKG